VPRCEKTSDLTLALADVLTPALSRAKVSGASGGGDPWGRGHLTDGHLCRAEPCGTGACTGSRAGRHPWVERMKNYLQSQGELGLDGEVSAAGGVERLPSAEGNAGHGGCGRP